MTAIDDQLYGIRTILRCGAEKFTDRQRARLERAIAADGRHDEVLVAWLCAQKLRSAYNEEPGPETPDRRRAHPVAADLPDPGDQATRQDSEAVARSILGLYRRRPCQQRRHGGDQRPLELHRRVARGFRNRDHYRLRMLLIGGCLTHPHLR
ncbi:hypothetical protein [Nocardioides sambongensis]|nr:hypothetical protein [Nocardioides sambongensis]